MRHPLAVSSLVLALVVAFVGCSPSATAQPELIEKIRQEVAKSLKKDVSQIDVRKPLGDQGVDELDIVEIVVAVEKAFKIEIPDSAVGEKPGEIAKTLTVQKLADIVAAQTAKQKR